MTAFNAEAYIREAIDSVLNQDYPHWELLVCDDGSKDRTRAIIAEYGQRDSRIKVSIAPNNLGCLTLRNRLLGASSGAYVTYQDADDRCAAHRLSTLINTLKKNPGSALVGSAVEHISEKGVPVRQRQFPNEWSAIKPMLLEETRFPFVGASVLFERRVYEEIGGLRPFFDRLGWEDHDFLIRACEKFKACNSSDVLYFYRDNPFSVTRKVDSSERRKLYIKKIGIELAKQRMVNGTDMIMQGDVHGLFDLVQKYDLPFQLDPSLFYRIMADRLRGAGRNSEALEVAFRAVRTRPLSIANIKSALKCAVHGTIGGPKSNRPGGDA